MKLICGEGGCSPLFLLKTFDSVLVEETLALCQVLASLLHDFLQLPHCKGLCFLHLSM